MSHITIKDISKILGVNPSTVSRALNDHKDISDELKHKIKAVALELNYTPNYNAVQFRKRKSMTIGVILPDFSMFFIPSVINSIIEELKNAGYKTLILCSQDSLDQEIENIKICCSSRVDAVLLSITNQTQNLEHLQIAKDMEIPIVLFDKSLNQSEYDEVLIDSTSASKECIDYLEAQGCKKILAAFGCQSLAMTNEREKGVKDVLGENYLKYYAINSLSSKEQAIFFLSNYPEIDGIFAMSDEILLGIQAAMNSEMKSKKIKLISISDGILPQFIQPPIPYLKHDGAELGKVASRFLISKLQNAKDVNVYRHFIGTTIVSP
jgi:LacI family transcriptional regulator